MTKRRRRRFLRRLTLFLLLSAGVVATVLAAPSLRAARRVKALENAPAPDWIQQAYISNENARIGVRLADFTGIVIHYVGNPGSTAKNNRDYFNNLALTKATYASSHFIVGLEGEIIQCVPLNEIAYASNSRNADTVSIENCHPDETGEFSDVTYDSLVKLAGWLCFTYDLEEDQIIRHYDVKGKLCPLYYVENEDAWTALRADIMAEKARLVTAETEKS